jgi:putative PEP-CTERM system TPR-repeat lipoprotein
MAVFSWCKAGAAVVLCGMLLLCVVLSGCGKTESVPELIEKAEQLRDAGNLPAAIIELSQALKQEPNNIAGRLLSAKLYIDLGQGDAALGIVKYAREKGAPELDLIRLEAEAELLARRYNEVIETTATPPSGATDALRASLLAFRGQALALLGQPGPAHEALNRGLELDPRSVDVRIAAIRLSIAEGNLDAAAKQLAETVHEAPRDRRLNQLGGDLAYAARNYGEAEQIYQKILDAEPWNQLARADLAACQLAENKLTEAAANLDVVVMDPNADPMVTYIRAVVAYRQKDYSAAQSYAEKVVTRVATFEPARLIASAASYALHEYQRAYYYLDPYVHENPDNPLGRKLLAGIQLHLDQPAQAAKTLAPLKDGPIDDPELLAMIGIASARSGDMAAAQRFLQLAVEQKPDDLLLRTELGRAELALGNSQAGIDDLIAAAKAHPESLVPQVPLFVAYMQAKQYDKALAVAEQVTAAEPDAAVGHLLRSAVYLARGDKEAGRQALLKARAVHPGDVNANRNLAKLALSEGKLDEARQYYRDILKHDPKHSGTYIALAEIEADHDRLPDAEAVLVEGVQANPDDRLVNEVLARLLLAEGKAGDALERGQQFLRSFPRDPIFLDVVGKAQLALGQRDDALSTFRNLVEIAPKAARAHTDLAEAYLAGYSADRPQWQAINEAIEAVKLAPEDKAARLLLARALVVHGRFGEAREAVEALKRDHPDDVAVAELEGMVARGEGRPADAAAAFTRAVTLKDNRLDRQRLADVQLHAGQADAAAKTLTDWLAAHSEDAEMRKMLANIYVGTGRLAEAGEQYAALVALAPENAELQNNLAWVLSRLGRTADALVHAKKAVALDPDSVDALDTYGAVLLQQGDPALAAEFLDKAWQNSSHRADVGFHYSQALAAMGKKPEALKLLHELLASGGKFEERAQAEQLLQALGG